MSRKNIRYKEAWLYTKEKLEECEKELEKSKQHIESREEYIECLKKLVEAQEKTILSQERILGERIVITNSIDKPSVKEEVRRIVDSMPRINPYSTGGNAFLKDNPMTGDGLE